MKSRLENTALDYGFNVVELPNRKVKVVLPPRREDRQPETTPNFVDWETIYYDRTPEIFVGTHSAAIVFMRKNPPCQFCAMTGNYRRATIEHQISPYLKLRLCSTCNGLDGPDGIANLPGDVPALASRSLEGRV
ncbi:MAG: hypothetical protein ACYDHD_00145 [Vulcanimicrobiaceae bacterium]